MKVFVINLPHRQDKRDAILKQGVKYDIPMEIIEAVNGNMLAETELVKTVFDYPACALTKGVIGCALSHLKIYKKIIDDNFPIALVLEDDAILHEDLREVLEKIEALDRNETPQVCLFSSHYHARPALQRLDDKYTLHQFIDGSQGHGYALNRKAAESLYKNLLPIKWEADKWYYFQQMGLVSVNCVVPHIIGVNGVAEISDLHAERALQNKKRRKYLNRLRNIVSRKQQLKKLLWKISRRPFSQKS
jgi:glycosyl transferase family 25